MTAVEESALAEPAATHFVELSELMASKVGSVNPKSFLDEEFELFSIPAFDKGPAELVLGNEVGSSKQNVQPGDVLLSKIVPHIRRSWIVTPNRGVRQIASGEWIIFRDPRIHGPYLRQVLVSDHFNAQFMQTVAGVGGSLLRARPAHVAKIRIPLPSLPEQRRIAAILDKADRLRTQRREALAHLDALTQSIFDAMFGGIHEKYPLGSAMEVQTGSTPSRAYLDNYGGGIPWVKSTEVQMGRILKTGETLSRAGVDSSNCKIFPPESIALAMYGQGRTRGQVGLLKIHAASNQACAILLPSNTIDSSFMFEQLKSLYTNIRGLARGGNQANLNLSLVRSIPVVLPPLELQQIFARRVAGVERLKEQHRTQLAELDALFASLQHRAFRGEL